MSLPNTRFRSIVEPPCIDACIFRFYDENDDSVLYTLDGTTLLLSLYIGFIQAEGECSNALTCLGILYDSDNNCTLEDINPSCEADAGSFPSTNEE